MASRGLQPPQPSWGLARGTRAGGSHAVPLVMARGLPSAGDASAGVGRWRRGARGTTGMIQRRGKVGQPVSCSELGGGLSSHVAASPNRETSSPTLAAALRNIIRRFLPWYLPLILIFLQQHLLRVQGTVSKSYLANKGKKASGFLVIITHS